MSAPSSSPIQAPRPILRVRVSATPTPPPTTTSAMGSPFTPIVNALASVRSYFGSASDNHQRVSFQDNAKSPLPLPGQDPVVRRSSIQPVIPLNFPTFTEKFYTHHEMHTLELSITNANGQVSEHVIYEWKTPDAVKRTFTTTKFFGESLGIKSIQIIKVDSIENLLERTKAHYLKSFKLPNGQVAPLVAKLDALKYNGNSLEVRKLELFAHENVIEKIEFKHDLCGETVKLVYENKAFDPPVETTDEMAHYVVSGFSPQHLTKAGYNFNENVSANKYYSSK